MTYEMSLIDEQPVTAVVTTSELALRLVPVHMVVQAFARKKSLLAHAALEVRVRVILLNVMLEIMAVSILFAANFTGIVLDHMNALHVDGTRCCVLKTFSALRAVIGLIWIVADANVL